MAYGDAKMDRGRQAAGKSRWGCAALLLAIALAAGALGVQLSRQHASRPLSGPAPDFAMTLFDGGEFRLSDYRGKVALINFWASWCPPCRDEAPELQALYDDFREEGLVVMGVNMLEGSRDKALAFLNEFHITYPNAEDIGERVTKLYRVEAPPESFLIDRKGDVRAFFIGGLRYDAARPEVEALLAEAA